MNDILIKSIIGGLIIGVVSTLAQKNPTAGAFIMGIPLVSIITLSIMHYSGVDYQTFRTFSYQTSPYNHIHVFPNFWLNLYLFLKHCMDL